MHSRDDHCRCCITPARAARIAQHRFCVDCGVDTIAINEYYELNDTVWAQGRLSETVLACLGCVERRIGRELRRADFLKCPLNDEPSGRRLARLRDRLRRGRPAPAIIQALDLNLAGAIEPALRTRLIDAINAIVARRRHA
jgi:hypothetical protein